MYTGFEYTKKFQRTTQEPVNRLINNELNRLENLEKKYSEMEKKLNNIEKKIETKTFNQNWNLSFLYDIEDFVINQYTNHN